MNWEAIIWFGLVILLVAVEANTVTLVSAWFAAGALAAMIVSLIGGELWMQIVVFIAVSALLLICLRKIAQKWLTPRLTKTNLDAIVGSVCMVTGRIDNRLSTGQVKLGAMEWSARSTGDMPIEPGTQVRVDRIEGVKLYVSVVETVQV